MEVADVGEEGSDDLTGDAPASLAIDASTLPRARLDRALAGALASLGDEAPSRAEVQRWILAGRVTVAGVPLLDPSAKAPSAGVLSVAPAPPPTTALEPDASVVFGVVFEDEHLIVVDKPAGVVVHPSRGHAEGSLVQGLLAREGWPRVEGDPRDPEGHLRPGVVHRIDRGTSGLLVVAKSARAREGLKDLFARHDLERRYVAIVGGRAEAGTIDTPHGRHPRDRLRWTSLSPVGATRRAVTHVEVVERLAEATVVSCRLETGRTHQIRVHLTERGMTPILGDPLYGRPPAGAIAAEVHRALGRQALHAERLGFVHPITGESLAWVSPWPDDLLQALERLRRSPPGSPPGSRPGSRP